MQILFMLALAAAQEPLSIQQAVETALAKNAAIEAAAAGVAAADARVAGSRGALLPQVSFSESWQRSNNQVFVFGSLLTQQQFTPANFDIGLLNSPPFLNNFQTRILAEQILFDGGRRQGQVRTAELARSAASQGSRRAEIDVIAAVLRSYYGALLAQENLRVAGESVKSAEADLKRAEARRTAGVITDADVLSLRVHLAAMREREIRRRADRDVELAALNQAMGLPLDTAFDLTTSLKTAPPPAAMGELARPELEQARLGQRASEQQARVARAARLPEFYLQAGFEADRQRFVTRGGANWMAAAGLRWNLFNGFSDRARVAEAEHEAVRARAQARWVESGVRLEARKASLDLESAQQRIEVARAAVAMADESLRIVKNRYEAGLTEVTELLRSETALLEARTRELAAVHDQRIAAVALEAARGTLNAKSEVVTQ
jgi:outer membrane protein TolC